VRAGVFGLIAAATMVAAPAVAAVRVVATTSDMAALVAVVGGDLVTVETLVPATTDPEAFEPSPGDLERLRRARLLVRVGLGYDAWLEPLIAKTAGPRLRRGGDGYLDASVGIPLLEVRGQGVSDDSGHAHGAANPHYWLDPANARIVTAAVAEALVRELPSERRRLDANRDRFLAELDARLERWTAALTPFAGVRLIAYHNTWPYFARRFRLDVVGYVEPRPGVAPSPSHLGRLIGDGRKSGVRAVVHEPYEPEDASRFVADKLAIPVVRLATSVGSLPYIDDYLALIDFDVATLVRALAGSPEPK
jgi:ABC-type Zn uptake system ZnuABC Zn-binding protein ZnuA